ncbi:DUF4145 domain-containing protein [Deminuibacter soli]|uniref:DUF4145 domain-containing protein n=1 Tax=Deminuibacter soli TaxID=2291815 RepID=A0A3E1NIN1_9BACT|nr:DUF4145 domain-containing protein [Deminuibacter soli]RFM27772.1 DUF4145 domain-containing protein [Deminuibacter soli]
MTLDTFVHRINDFDTFTASSKIDYFVYYHTIVKGNEGATAKDIKVCFDELKTTKYSNIPQYLKNNTKKVKGKTPKFILQKGTYHLERSKKSEIDALMNVPRVVVPTNNYFPLELFDNTRGYLTTISQQAAACYDQGLYDACSVMTRKLLEVLIIEAFERHNISNKLKNSSDNFYYLSDLIEIFKSETTWNIGRNAKNSLPSLKKMGDLSAHNRRYIARKNDLDKLKDDLRIVLEELVHIIDYPNWK